jgi:hypothetical protein
MNVVEKDDVIVGLLRDELARCEEALAAIGKALADLPKGALSARKKLHGGREYRYYSLKFRDGEKVINQHVPSEALVELQNKLALRKRYLSEAKAYEKRIAYLKKLLKSEVSHGGSQGDR